MPRRLCIFFFVVSVTLGLAGCRAAANPGGDSSPSVASQGPPAKPRATGEVPVNLDAAREQVRQRVIEGVVQHAATRLGLSSSAHDIHRDDSVASEQAKFMDRDLKVSQLRRRSGVAFANLIQTVDGKRVHVGVVELNFPDCKDLNAAFEDLSKVGRDTFNVAALSVFRFFRRQNALVVLFSETPFHPKVRSLLDTVAQDAPGIPRCEGR